MGYNDISKRRKYARTWAATRRAAWTSEQGGCCRICGSRQDLEVDHIDPSLKTMNPTAIWSRRAEVRERELANCQVLCSGCHLAKTRAGDPIVVNHGDYGMYNKHGCRCDACRAANTARGRMRRAA